MGAMTLVADRRGCSLALASKGVLLLRYPDGTKRRIGLAALAGIVVVGEVSLASSLLRACNDEGIGVVLLPGRGTTGSTALLPGPNGRVRRRITQCRLQQDSEGRISVARRLVADKIAAQQEWLQAHSAAVELERFRRSALTAPDIASLMGTEGAAAARYYAAWGDLWGAEWGFRGRNRRPPRDPVNSLLSLGYTLAGNYVGRLAVQFGLDPVFGFLHETESSRDALMLDLLEPVRPWVDQRAWSLGADGLLRPEHFFTDEVLGCRLTKEGRSIYFSEWFEGEELWFRRPARRAIAIVLEAIRRFQKTTPG